MTATRARPRATAPITNGLNGSEPPGGEEEASAVDEGVAEEEEDDDSSVDMLSLFGLIEEGVEVVRGAVKGAVEVVVLVEVDGAALGLTPTRLEGEVQQRAFALLWQYAVASLGFANPHLRGKSCPIPNKQLEFEIEFAKEVYCGYICCDGQSFCSSA